MTTIDTTTTTIQQPVIVETETTVETDTTILDRDTVAGGRVGTDTVPRP
jgi:hypothetical protein